MKIRVSVINYSNTIPFSYGLNRSDYITQHSEFSSHQPAEGFEALYTDAVDISILPVATIPLFPQAHIVSDYCIGTLNTVASVKLFSKVPLEHISCITLDYQSRTSNMLAKLLAAKHWGINPSYMHASVGYEQDNSIEAKVIIGDRAMQTYPAYPYSYDLAYEWYKAYNMPFVFACWVANKPIHTEYIKAFNAALQHGINHIDEAIEASNKTTHFDLHHYLHHNINYILDQSKREAMQLFLDTIPSIS